MGKKSRMPVEKEKPEPSKDTKSREKMLHISESYKQIFKKEIWRSGNVEITSPVPETVATEEITKVSSGIGSTTLSPSIGVSAERKKLLFRRFSRSKKKGDK